MSGLTYMPMTGWGVAGVAVKDLDAPVRVAYAELDVRDYVFVPGDVVPHAAALATAALVQEYAARFAGTRPRTSADRRAASLLRPSIAP